MKETKLQKELMQNINKLLKMGVSETFLINFERIIIKRYEEMKPRKRNILHNKSEETSIKG